VGATAAVPALTGGRKPLSADDARAPRRGAIGLRRDGEEGLAERY
jgi:hypothetical protein